MRIFKDMQETLKSIDEKLRDAEIGEWLGGTQKVLIDKLGSIEKATKNMAAELQEASNKPPELDGIREAIEDMSRVMAAFVKVQTSLIEQMTKYFNFELKAIEEAKASGDNEEPTKDDLIF